MPNSFIKQVTEKCGISNKEAEEKWENAKKLALEKGFSEGSKSFYAYTMGIFKRSLGKECKSRLKESVAMDMFPTVKKLIYTIQQVLKKATKYYLHLRDQNKSKSDAIHIAASNFGVSDRDLVDYLIDKGIN